VPPPLTVAGGPIWVDLLTSDPDRALVFYAQLFGWTAANLGSEYGGYVRWSKHNLPVAGMTPNTSPAPDAWTVYLATDDAQGTAARATAAGGSVLLAKTLSDLGETVVLGDSTGAMVGAWQSGTFAGFGLVGESDTPVWHELHTDDYTAALTFYREVFDWEVESIGDGDDFRMSTLGSGSTAVAGIYDAARELDVNTAPHWLTYFGTPDADASAERITQLGGTVVEPIEDSEYGRLVSALDPTGASFALLQEPL
jgi:predicted enzyme related to lactoylglutathione lyase